MLFAEELLDDYQYKTHRPSAPQETQQFIESFCQAWKKSPDDVPVDPTAVLNLMSKRDRALEDAWTRYLPGEYPAVVIASVVGQANPFIVRAPGLAPLIVMCQGLSQFVFGMVLTSLLYAHNEAPADDCLAAMRRFMLSWLTNDPTSAPSGADIQRLSTANTETTTFAVGLSNCVLTWAFFHELGHLRLGHLGDSISAVHAMSDSRVTAEISTYSHAREFEADLFGLNHYLDLLKHEDQLRLEFEIGKQADHAPLIAFELMNLAYNKYRRHDRRRSLSHPPPLARRQALRQHGASRFSDEGIRFYDYWSDLLAHIKKAI